MAKKKKLVIIFLWCSGAKPSHCGSARGGDQARRKSTRKKWVRRKWAALWWCRRTQWSPQSTCPGCTVEAPRTRCKQTPPPFFPLPSLIKWRESPAAAAPTTLPSRVGGCVGEWQLACVGGWGVQPFPNDRPGSRQDGGGGGCMTHQRWGEAGVWKKEGGCGCWCGGCIGKSHSTLIQEATICQHRRRSAGWSMYADVARTLKPSIATPPHTSAGLH